MAGNKTGGLKAAETNRAKNKDFYRIIGARGGRNGHTGGFYVNRELASIAGRIGGQRSKPPRRRQESGDGPTVS